MYGFLFVYSTGQKYIYTGSYDSSVYIYDVVCIGLTCTCLSLYSLQNNFADVRAVLAIILELHA
jgi:hypothetical protein